MIPRAKGQFLQQATPHRVPKISGSYLSVDGMVDFDTVYLQEDYPLLFAELGITYNQPGDDDLTEFRTPTLSDWGLPELKTEVFTGSIAIDTYDTSLYDSGDFEAVLSTSAKKERLDIKIVNDATDIATDTLSIAVKDTYFDLTIATSIVSNRLRLTITDNGSEGAITIKYLVTPKPMVSTYKNMIRF